MKQKNPSRLLSFVPSDTSSVFYLFVVFFYFFDIDREWAKFPIQMHVLAIDDRHLKIDCLARAAHQVRLHNVYFFLLSIHCFEGRCKKMWRKKLCKIDLVQYWTEQTPTVYSNNQFNLAQSSVSFSEEKESTYRRVDSKINKSRRSVWMVVYFEPHTANNTLRHTTEMKCKLIYQTVTATIDVLPILIFQTYSFRLCGAFSTHKTVYVRCFALVSVKDSNFVRHTHTNNLM